jgi:AcrR family transcriptional regulator
MLLMSTCYSLQMLSPRPYHHGKLKRALIDAAVALVAEVGPQGFTLREVARRAGVSHNAPYRHFRDKDELLAAVARQGFERLIAAMRRSAARGSTAPERLRLCGRGYVSFALRWPEHFSVMFDSPSNQEKYPNYAAAGEEAFETLLRIIVECQETGVLSAGDPRQLALLSWSIVHGVAKLAISHHLPFGTSGVLVFTDDAKRAMLAGMANTSREHKKEVPSPQKSPIDRSNEHTMG